MGAGGPRQQQRAPLGRNLHHRHRRELHEATEKQLQISPGICSDVRAASTGVMRSELRPQRVVTRDPQERLRYGCASTQNVHTRTVICLLGSVSERLCALDVSIPNGCDFIGSDCVNAKIHLERLH